MLLSLSKKTYNNIIRSDTKKRSSRILLRYSEKFLSRRAPQSKWSSTTSNPVTSESLLGLPHLIYVISSHLPLFNFFTWKCSEPLLLCTFKISEPCLTLVSQSLHSLHSLFFKSNTIPTPSTSNTENKRTRQEAPGVIKFRISMASLNNAWRKTEIQNLVPPSNPTHDSPLDRKFKISLCPGNDPLQNVREKPNLNPRWNWKIFHTSHPQNTRGSYSRKIPLTKQWNCNLSTTCQAVAHLQTENIFYSSFLLNNDSNIDGVIRGNLENHYEISLWKRNRA